MPPPASTTASATPGPGSAEFYQERRRWWILAILGIAQLMVVLDATIVNIALPSAQADLGFSDSSRQWVVTAYSLAFGSLLLLGGRIADLFGRKITFLTGLAGFAAASAVGGAAGGFEMLVIARAVQGLFGALLAPAALSLLTTTFTDAKERGKAFGIYGAIAGAGGAVGLLLGGLLTEHLNWRWTLYINIVFAVVALAGGAVLLQRTPRVRTSALDVPGTVLASGGLFSVVYGFANAETHAWGSPLTWGFLAIGCLLLGAFGWWQTRAAHPLLPLRILLDRNRAASYLSMLIVGAGIFGVSLFLTYYLQLVLGYTPVRTGLAFLPMVASIMLASTAGSTVLGSRFAARPLVSVGMVLAAAGMLWLTALSTDSGYAAHVLPPLVVSGLGMGLIISTAMSQATGRVRPEDSGAASAMVNTAQQIGGSLGTALLNTLVAATTASYLVGKDASSPTVQAQAGIEGYATAYRWSALFFVIGAALTAVLYRRHNPADVDDNTSTAVPL
ncbi:MFS transporter [Streptomyces sp. NPDC088387]|uniref:MFS transporter n=1 Tax=Streptomyces sp. NPDC088387 TaxID=3365859 RepID=UPI003824552E